MNPILEQLINQLEFGDAANYRNLTIFPITYSGNGTGTIHYLTLDEAVEKQYIHITEVSQGGSVPDLTVTNKSNYKILMLDGEEVIGAKQNRILNTTILVPEKSTLTIPVSCVEAHRWHSVSPEFQSPGTHAHSHLRAKKAASVHKHLVEAKEYCSDQADTLEKYWKKLLRSYAIDALANLELSDSKNQTTNQPPDLNQLKDDLTKISLQILQSDFQSFKSVGLGDDIRIRGKNLVGATLVVNQTPIHLAVFRMESADNPGVNSNFATPFRRRARL